MNRNVKILDCTLRDGGRIIDCKFEDDTISGISRNLVNAGIDIVEIGFLRDHKLADFQGNSTFFTETAQIIPYIPKDRKNSMFVAFIDFDMYDFSILEECDGKSITGIRVGFTKTQFLNKKQELRECLLKVKEQGYTLFIQGVNSLGYSDRELLDVIEFVNDIMPYSYGIVDTYGGMYLEDMVHYYNLVDYNLQQDICIDIHSHNNFQSSFTFAQEIIRLSGGNRKIILDATMDGMGKCAGNLNTELIVDYLVRKKAYDYNIDLILDTIDCYLTSYKNNHSWGYSIPAFMSGIYRAHPNNVIYLTQKYRLSNRDIKYILSGIDEKKRQTYDYDNIQEVYRNYCQRRIDDRNTISNLRKRLEGKSILILVPGITINTYTEEIKRYIEQVAPIVISVNFIPKQFEVDLAFYANTIHWEKVSSQINHSKCILTSNIYEDTKDTCLVDYSTLIVEDSILYDNSTIMLLNLLKDLCVAEIKLAGFDGLKENADNYVNSSFPNTQAGICVDEINKEIRRLYRQYENKVEGKIKVGFLTPSIYERF